MTTEMNDEYEGEEDQAEIVTCKVCGEEFCDYQCSLQDDGTWICDECPVSM